MRRFRHKYLRQMSRWSYLICDLIGAAALLLTSEVMLFWLRHTCDGHPFL
jgi:hypothetical protein